MKFDPTDRLEKINEAVTTLLERSRAAQREAQRTGRGEMVTGRDGKQYPLGADPTRAQPGSALYQAPAPPPERTSQFPGSRTQPTTPPATRPAAPAPAARPAAPAKSSLGNAAAAVSGFNAQRPAAPATSSLGSASAAVSGFNTQRPAAAAPTQPSYPRVSMGTDQASNFMPTAPAAPATAARSAAPAAPAPTSGRQPGSLPQIERQLQSAPTSTQTSGRGKGSLEQDLQSAGGILRSVGLLPASPNASNKSSEPMDPDTGLPMSASRNTPAVPASAAQTAKTPASGGYTPPAREDIRDIRSRRAAEVKPGENRTIEVASGPVYSFAPKDSVFGSETKSTQKADISSTGRAGISPTDKPYDQYGADEGDRGASANYAARQARRATGDTRSGQEIMAANAARAEENRRIQRGIAYEPVPATQYTSTTRSQ